MNTPTNKRIAGTKVASPLTPTASVNPAFVLSPITTASGENPQQRLETLLKQLLVWHGKWQAAHRRGISLCSSIEGIKRRAIDQKENDKNVDLYPVEELQIHCNNLAVIMTIFEDVISNVRLYMKQLTTLVQADGTRVIYKSWQMRQFLEVVHKIYVAYKREFQLKTIVKENMAHGTSKSELAWHSSVWQYSFYVNSDIDLLLKCIEMEIS